MFSLDEEITKWRRLMLAKHVASAEALDELECHLRDDVAEQLRAGLSAEMAFEAAVERIGQANLLRREFEKIDETPEVATWTARITVIERDIMLPIKAVVIPMLVYFLYTKGWFGSVTSLGEVLLSGAALKLLLWPYVVLNVVLAGSLLAIRRLPVAWVRSVVFTASLVDGFLISLLCLVTGGSNSIVYWVFLGLILRNTVSNPRLISQLLLNLSVTGCYALAAQLDVSLAGGLTPGERAVLELYAGDQTNEVVLLRVMVLLLMTICCASVQFILTRQRLRQVTT